MTGLPASKKQIAAMGERLRTGTQTGEDETLLRATLGAFDEVRQEVFEAVEAIRWVKAFGPGSSAAVTSRTKTRGTLVDKLRRQPGIKLPYVRDVAGVRVVADISLGGQDRVASMIGELGLLTNERLVDRRLEPIQGYRALHLTGSLRGMSVEIQIRTALQAAWANLYEGFGDRWGRSIRYSDAPVRSLTEVLSLMDDVTLHNAPELILELLRFVSVDLIAHHEETEQRLWSEVLKAGGMNPDYESRIRLASRSPLMLARYPEWAELTAKVMGPLDEGRRGFAQVFQLAARTAASIPPGDDSAV